MGRTSCVALAALFLVSGTGRAAERTLELKVRTVAPATAARCTLTVSACFRRGHHGAVVRLGARGPRPGTPALTEALRALPGATAVGRDVVLAPPLADACTASAPFTLHVRRTHRLVLVGRTVTGHRMRGRVRVRCGARTRADKRDWPPDPDPPGGDGPGSGGAGGPPPHLAFTREVVDSRGGGQVTESVAVGDLDGDGRPDVVVGGDERLIWYHAPGWTLHPIASGQFGAGAMTVVRDIDGDGRLDVVTGTSDGTVWFANRPGGWKRHTLASAHCHDLVFGDLDGDGRPDAVCVDQQAARVVWLQGPADPTAVWPERTIEAGESAMGLALADVDRDGRLDVVAGRAWYRNTGGGVWPRTDYATLRVGGYERFADFAKVGVLDLDGDGRLDVFATLYAETPAGEAWAFLQPPDPARDAWTAVRVDEGPLFGVHSLAVASFDGSARPQVMVGETNIGGFGFGVAPSPHVYVYRLLGPATDPSSWERTTVDTLGTHEAQAADLDGDGLPDIVGHEENTDLVGRDGAVHWWRNATAVGRQ